MKNFYILKKILYLNKTYTFDKHFIFLNLNLKKNSYFEKNFYILIKLLRNFSETSSQLKKHFYVFKKIYILNKTLHLEKDLYLNETYTF